MKTLVSLNKQVQSQLATQRTGADTTLNSTIEPIGANMTVSSASFDIIDQFTSKSVPKSTTLSDFVTPIPS